jgi:hypothetical protein
MAKAKKVVAKTAKGKRVRFELLADAAYIVNDCIVHFEAAYRISRGDPSFPPLPVYKARAKRLFKKLLLKSTERALGGATIPWPVQKILDTASEHGRTAWTLVKSEKTGPLVNLEQVLETHEVVKAKRCPDRMRGRSGFKPLGFVCDF